MKKIEKANSPPQQSKDQKKTVKSIQSDLSENKSTEIKSHNIPKIDSSKLKYDSKSSLPDIETIKSNLSVELSIPKLNLSKQKTDSDSESTKSTIDKMYDFLSQHEIESSLSVQDSTQPIESMVSASFPIDYKQMELEKKEKIPKLTTIKQALESRRSDFEEIKAHLERRTAEMRKRIKKIGDKEDETKDDKKSDKSLVLSYHSTEFTPDLDMGCVLFKKGNDSLTNLDRLKMITDKQLNQQKAENQNLKQKSKVDECGFTTHAIFAHLAKLQNVKKVFKSSSKTNLSKIDKTIKNNIIKDDMIMKKSDENIVKIKSEDTLKREKTEEDNLIDKTNKNMKSKELKRVDSDPSLALSDPKASTQSITSIISKHSDE